ncbi:efflux transporter periplasmic adaptor subunit [Reichenbachiella sp. 5M10]|uniref:efflux RND transporter periplasmic adaptor subunit n=1 Tax=Reichenbachiella sp. 5M10 TaxID=1889772 RepID=UPI000C15833B|nr:efflux RND transporter periplasmic adaptor subunit [Reichenbachiella sp. 5M10]PIB34933.1 efflux transporter periplasmic adaptor subunit [Reichenbachiella sp. 5M10]
MKDVSKQTVVVALATLLLGFLAGWLLMGEHSSEAGLAVHTSEVAHQEWTCSMHPQIRQSEPGQCPICGMELIPVYQETETASPLEGIKLSSTAMQLASVQTAAVRRQQPVKELRLSGTVQPDERRVSSQTSHITGRIEALKVNYTGEYVRRGQVIAYVYSPELVTAQRELFEANKIRNTQPALYQAARDKLKNWKLTDRQIDSVLESGKPLDNFPILSDLNGVVIDKRVNLGDHIQQGEALFEVADLSQLWVLFDVYERDMSWVKVGDRMTFAVQSLPGSQFQGKVSFIDPVIDSRSRVAKARVTVSNTEGRLKPEMFVTGELESPLEEVSPTIVVPKSAVMWTGERSIVYVKVGQGEFVLREVILGPSLGDRYMIQSGLREGEEIVIHGTFSVDAAAQLAGKPSMMNQEGGVMLAGHHHAGMDGASAPKEESTLSAKAQIALEVLYKDYFRMKDELVRDDFVQAKERGEQLSADLSQIPMSLFATSTHETWMTTKRQLEEPLARIHAYKTIAELRTGFIEISEAMIGMTEVFGTNEEELYVHKCPMANRNQGAIWMSEEVEVNNPYFGSEMPKCGEVIKRFTRQ